MPKKIPSPRIPPPVSPTKIVVTKAQEDKIKEFRDGHIIFSFEYLDRSNNKFNLGGTCVEWFVSLFDTLKDISQKTFYEFTLSASHYDYHKHDWKKTSEKGFPFSSNSIQYDGAQFRLSSSKGRVHGFFIGHVFYIVWIDPHHNLYPDERYGGIHYYERPKDCTEYLNERILKLESELRSYETILDKQTAPQS